MASRIDSIDEIYINPYGDIGDSTDVYVKPQHEIVASSERIDGAARSREH